MTKRVLRANIHSIERKIDLASLIRECYVDLCYKRRCSIGATKTGGLRGARVGCSSQPALCSRLLRLASIDGGCDSHQGTALRLASIDGGRGVTPEMQPPDEDDDLDLPRRKRPRASAPLYYSETDVFRGADARAVDAALTSIAS